MAGPIARVDLSAARTAAAVARDRGGYGAALSLLASLFFMWGFITVINNTLLPHLRSVFDLDYTQTTLIESVWFIAYFVASIPAAKLIARVGYKRALVTGLGIMALGTLGMVLASHQVSYAITLTALFVIASGITLLQVAANPYVAVVGPSESAPARLNLVQAFNSLGTTLAPLFGGYLILGRSASGNAAAGTVLTPAERLADAQSVQLPYLIVAAILVMLAVVIARFPLPAMGGADSAAVPAAKAERAGLSLWRHRNLVLGVPAIFIYLIAEIGVSNLFINFVAQPEIGDLTHAQAARYLFLLWGGMMVGRFVGSYLMQRRTAEAVLA
ncbi:MAG: MFS transporter, partial [Hyphomicrobiales bacterium]